MSKPASYTAYVLNVEVSRQTLLDLMVTAIEGGSNYWAAFSDAERDDDLNYLKIRVIEHEAGRDGHPRVNRFITPLEMAHGLETLARAAINDEHGAYGKHLGQALSQSGDAITADVVLQFALFGELVYG